MADSGIIFNRNSSTLLFRDLEESDCVAAVVIAENIIKLQGLDVYSHGCLEVSVFVMLVMRERVLNLQVGLLSA